MKFKQLVENKNAITAICNILDTNKQECKIKDYKLVLKLSLFHSKVKEVYELYDQMVRAIEKKIDYKNRVKNIVDEKNPNIVKIKMEEINQEYDDEISNLKNEPIPIEVEPKMLKIKVNKLKEVGLTPAVIGDLCDVGIIEGIEEFLDES